MKRKIALALAVIIATAGFTFAQAPEPNKNMVTETLYLLPKRNMNEKLEAALKSHNDKYHPEGPHRAALRRVDYGDKAGWYVWLMGPTTYDAFDSRPDKGAHDEDWTKNVDPLIEEYGATDFWEFDANYSFGREIFMQSGHYDVWAVKLNPGGFARFNDLIMKFKKTYESMGSRAFLVYRNPIHRAEGADVALLASYTSIADWAADWKVKDAYEKLYGAGSWQLMWQTWNDVVASYDEELRSFVK
jgi:hypothetical protein